MVSLIGQAIDLGLILFGCTFVPLKDLLYTKHYRVFIKKSLLILEILGRNCHILVRDNFDKSFY